MRGDPSLHVEEAQCTTLVGSQMGLEHGCGPPVARHEVRPWDLEQRAELLFQGPVRKRMKEILQPERSVQLTLGVQQSLPSRKDV